MCTCSDLSGLSDVMDMFFFPDQEDGCSCPERSCKLPGSSFLRRVSESWQSLAAGDIIGDSLLCDWSGRLKIGVGENICEDESVDEKELPPRRGVEVSGVDEKPK